MPLAIVVRHLSKGGVPQEIPSMESLRQEVLAGQCPFCKRDGFRVVAVHVYLKHGLLRREMSDLLGFTYSQSILPEEVSRKMRESAGPPPAVTRVTGPRRMSLKAIALRREQMAVARKYRHRGTGVT